MKFPFPVLISPGEKLTLVQPFHVNAPTSIADAYKVQTVDHLGVDVTCGTAQNTWGKSCVWPFPWPGMAYDSQVDSLFGANVHAHAQVDTIDPSTGIQYSLIYLHVSAVTHTKTPTDSLTFIYQQGDVVARIGNNGAVSPMPTPAHPYDGSHIHLGLGIKKPGELNYTMVDPLDYFDLVPVPVDDDLPSTKLLKLADSMQTTNPTQAAIVRAVGNLLKAFNN